MKTWFIAEASQGLGRECALAALERGDLVAVSAADATALNEPPLRVVIGNNAGLTDRGYRPADDARDPAISDPVTGGSLSVVYR